MTPADRSTKAEVRNRPGSPLRLRPKASASLILIDRSRPSPHVLVGRRGSGHAFMPDLYVFPGGRRDNRDHALPFSQDLNPSVVDLLLRRCPPSMGASGARALALAALRELHEETGLRLGPTLAPDVPYCPDLSSLRFVARAVTPPGAVRRFDNRFFATFVDEASIDLNNLRESDELSDFRWLDLAALTSVPLPEIVAVIARDLKISLESDPSLPFGNDVYAYTNRNGQFLRSRL
ncbi:NUDIX domain-containing protein [Affinirhizobium pseudoryzae]|uniref:NUDIX domain-containing protein n=1 Tax=Allorhizobium pseudoryzae TaxID=379684 RepID=UPI0013EDE74C|nr:NUDIX hydrolase [Allorhizobium pseudoryzae]